MLMPDHLSQLSGVSGVFLLFARQHAAAMDSLKMKGSGMSAAGVWSLPHTPKSLALAGAGCERGRQGLPHLPGTLAGRAVAAPALWPQLLRYLLP